MNSTVSKPFVAMNKPSKLLIGLLSAACLCGVARAGEVEVLHFWTSPGEAQSVEKLKALIAVRGHTWKDFAVVGGGGQNAMEALKQRVASGRPPAAATIKGPAVQEWAAQGALANLDAMASFDHWDDVIPKVIQAHVKYRDHYVAVPVNIHRTNWMWSNLAVLKNAGVDAPPRSFAELLAAAEKIKAAGFIPIAHGGQPWQDFVLFESVALGVGGADFYRNAFIKLEPSALSGAEMRKTLESFRRLKAYTDDKSRGRDWNVATNMVIQGRAGFQFMGDWSKGEFVAAGKEQGKDYACSPAPGSAGSFAYVIDTFAMFQLKNWDAQKAQGYLAYVLLGKEFQDVFNRRKGSIPVRMDLSLEKFDDCAKASRVDFDASAKTNSLIPSVAVDMALPTGIQASVRSVISDFWNNDGLSVNETIGRLLAAVNPKPGARAEAASR